MQKSHYLISYKKLLYYTSYSKKSFLNIKNSIFICRNTVKLQKSVCYKELLLYPPYSKKTFLNGKKSIFICRNSRKVQKSHYLGSYKKTFSLSTI